MRAGRNATPCQESKAETGTDKKKAVRLQPAFCENASNQLVRLYSDAPSTPGDPRGKTFLHCGIGEILQSCKGISIRMPSRSPHRR